MQSCCYKPIVGIEFRYNNKLLYIGLAKNAAGLAEMNRFLTQHILKRPYLHKHQNSLM
jgi:DNA polymerase-3 subunit alpha/error-prone DNA polymerase